MTLAKGPHHLAIPGPSIIPDRVQRAMHRASPNIYEGELVDITQSLISDLKLLANCTGDVAIYHGNGHAVWEASLCNLFSAGDRVMILDTGRFGQGWGLMAVNLGLDVVSLEFARNSQVDAGKLADELKADTAHKIKAVLTVQTDTSTSSSNDLEAIRQAIDSVGHPALLMVDAIASFGCEPFDMQAVGADVFISASQKGLMTPPGIALLFVSDRVWEFHESAGLNTPYWDMLPRIRPTMFPDHFCGTPPTHHLYGLREAVDMILEEGIVNVWSRHRIHAHCVWAAIDAWSLDGELTCLIPNSKDRSLAVTAVLTGAGDALRLRQWCEQQVGVTLGIGLGASATRGILDNVFRIGHMGHLNPPTLLGVLACIDTGLKSLDIVHGPNALNAASQVLSESISRLARSDSDV